MHSVFRNAFAVLLVLSFASLARAHEGVVHEGCASGQSFSSGLVVVTGAYLRATPPGAKAAAAYMTLSNIGNETDTLTSVTSEAAANVALHSMTMKDGVMEMAKVEGDLSILPGENIVLEPKGLHLMLTGLEQSFDEGACLEMILHFDKGKDLPIELNIGGFAQDGPPDGTAAAPDHDMSGMSSMEGM